MIAESFDRHYTGYRIKLVVAIEKESVLSYQNELMVPLFFRTLDEAQEHISLDIRRRLTQSLYFRSQKRGFDLVLYRKVATSNTYLGYRIIPIHAPSREKDQPKMAGPQMGDPETPYI